MKRFVLTAAFCVATVPAFAQGTSSEAMQIALQNNPCGDREIVSARFIDENTVGVRCDDDDGAAVIGATATGAVVATNFVPVAAGLFAVVLGAAAAGTSSSTSDTQ